MMHVLVSLKIIYILKVMNCGVCGLGLDVIMQSAYVKDITYDLESYIPRINEGVVILSVTYWQGAC